MSSTSMHFRNRMSCNYFKLVCLIPGAEFKVLTFSDYVICVSDAVWVFLPAAQVSLAKEILSLVKIPDLIKVI